MTPMVGTKHMSTVAVGIMCKTPLPGQSKTRLSPPLQPDECAELSACFIRDLSRTIDYAAVCDDLRHFVSGREDKLIETLANKMAEHLLRRFAARRVELELRKFVLPETRYVAARVTREMPRKTSTTAAKD